MFQIAIYAFDPIGWEIVKNSAPSHWIHDPTNWFVRLMNIIWFIFLGWEFFILHVMFAIIQACTIIGIGNAIKQLMIAKETLFPFGKTIRMTTIPTRPVKPGTPIMGGEVIAVPVPPVYENQV